jgi:hypothetical protein
VYWGDVSSAWEAHCTWQLAMQLQALVCVLKRSQILQQLVPGTSMFQCGAEHCQTQGRAHVLSVWCIMRWALSLHRRGLMR